MYTDADLRIAIREPTGLEMLRYVRSYQAKMKRVHAEWLDNKAPTRMHAMYPPPWLPQWRRARQRQFASCVDYLIKSLEEMENVG